MSAFAGTTSHPVNGIGRAPSCQPSLRAHAVLEPTKRKRQIRTRNAEGTAWATRKNRARSRSSASLATNLLLPGQTILCRNGGTACPTLQPVLPCPAGSRITARPRKPENVLTHESVLPHTAQPLTIVPSPRAPSRRIRTGAHSRRRGPSECEPKSTVFPAVNHRARGRPSRPRHSPRQCATQGIGAARHAEVTWKRNCLNAPQPGCVHRRRETSSTARLKISAARSRPSRDQVPGAN